MIRSALIALGLSAGAAQGQGLVPTAPLLETCGGTRLVLEAVAANDDGLENASDVVSARIGGAFSQIFDYADVVGGQIVVSMPAGFQADEGVIDPLTRRVAFGFHQVVSRVTGEATDLGAGQIALPAADQPDLTYILNATAILDGDAVMRAVPVFDENGAPAVSFWFDDAGAAVFADFTRDNIGEPFAIVLNDQVTSAPVIRDVITGGEGMIFGIFTIDEAAQLSAVLQGGVLPFDLDVSAVETVDGSDPSADFCP